MKKAIIFDMDGTLLKTEIILEPSLNQTLKLLDSYKIEYIDHPIQKYKEIMGVPLKAVWQTLLKSPTSENIETANHSFQKSLISTIAEGSSQLYDYTLEILKYLKTKGYAIFIASNGDKEYLDAICKHHNLDDYITNVYSINLIESGSKSELVKHIKQEEGIDPKYIVGDRLSDIIAGKENNIETIGCRFYFSKEEELQQADHIIDSLIGIKRIVI